MKESKNDCPIPFYPNVDICPSVTKPQHSLTWPPKADQFWRMRIWQKKF